MQEDGNLCSSPAGCAEEQRLDSPRLLLGVHVLGEGCGCPEHLLVPSGIHSPAPGAMLWSPAGASIPAHIPALIPALTAFAWCFSLKGWSDLEPPESQGLAFISAVGTEH